MRIRAADIVSEPYDGAAYADGERIEVRVMTSEPARMLTDPLTVPLKFGAGAQEIRHASLDTVVGSYIPINISGTRGNGYQLYFSYVVKADDVDADGVELVADPLGTESDRRIEPALDSRMRMDLAFPARAPGAGQTVDGSQTLGCVEVYCGYVTVDELSFGEIGYDTSINNSYYVGQNIAPAFLLCWSRALYPPQRRLLRRPHSGRRWDLRCDHPNYSHPVGTGEAAFGVGGVGDNTCVRGCEDQCFIPAVNL